MKQTFSKRQIFDFTGTEICSNLIKATMWNNGGTEDVTQNNRYEPWVAFYRPLQKRNHWWELHYGSELIV